MDRDKQNLHNFWSSKNTKSEYWYVHTITQGNKYQLFLCIHPQTRYGISLWENRAEDNVWTQLVVWSCEEGYFKYFCPTYSFSITTFEEKLMAESESTTTVNGETQLLIHAMMQSAETSALQ